MANSNNIVTNITVDNRKKDFKNNTDIRFQTYIPNKYNSTWIQKNIAVVVIVLCEIDVNVVWRYIKKKNRLIY